MIQIQQELQGLADNGVGLFTFDVDHKPDAAAVMFELWIVQSLLAWRLDSRRQIILPA